MITGKRLLIVSDAWHPQLNGVVRTLDATIAELRAMGFVVDVIAPGQNGAFTFPMPFYPEIRLEPFGSGRIKQKVAEFRPDYIHITTEGPLGSMARLICLAEGRPFTTAYHTCFPEYIAERVNKIPLLSGWGGKLAQYLAYHRLRHFHNAASAVMVATPALAHLLRSHKVQPERLRLWSRGVDMQVFTPSGASHAALEKLKRPIALSVGRIAVEKNLRAFLAAPFAGSKLIIGDGPELAALREDFLPATHPDVHFIGAVTDQKELAAYYRGADLFVFSSHTDTFGLVMLEAMASGLPVAACHGPGQAGVFAKAEAQDFFCLNNDLAQAMQDVLAMRVAAEKPRDFVMRHYSWTHSTGQFIAAMQTTMAPLKSPLLVRWAKAYFWALPLQLLERLPAAPLLQWCSKRLLATAQSLWRRHTAKTPPDHFA